MKTATSMKTTMNTMTESAGASASTRPRMRERLDREAGARRTLFVAGLAAFASLFGVIASTAPSATPSSEPAAETAGLNAERLVVAEPPLSRADTPADRKTVVRIVASDQRAPAPHVRTRATP